MKKILLSIAFAAIFGITFGQNFGATPEYVKSLTPLWKGERFPDGRPKVSDNDLKRLEKCTLEQIWSYLYEKGYRNQVEVDWTILKTGNTMVGRAVTSQFMPYRPDFDSLITILGKQEKRSQSGGKNTWVIDALVKDDIYVADGFGKVDGGTLIGSSLGNSITSKTGKGVIFYGSIRDMQELKDTEGFNAWVKGSHPSYWREMIPTSFNAPIRVGAATVFPGDVVFANDYGVVFIPAHMIGDLLTKSEIVNIRDYFEREMVKSNKYTTGEVHGNWSPAMKKVFRDWFIKYPNKGAVTLQQVDDYLEIGKEDTQYAGKEKK